MWKVLVTRHLLCVASLFPGKVQVAHIDQTLLPSQHTSSQNLSNQTFPDATTYRMPASSIQSFFSSSPTKNSDGFTAEEVQSALQPSGASASAQWTVSKQRHLTSQSLTRFSRLSSMKKQTLAISSPALALSRSRAASSTSTM